MIDIQKAFPTKEQVMSYDLWDECNELFNAHLNQFNRRKEKAPSLNAMLVSEIERLEAMRDNIKPPQIVRFIYDKINLYPYFKEGWQSCIRGIFKYPNNGYKFCDEVIGVIKTKYRRKNPPIHYFQKLSKVAMEEVIHGMAMAKYYLWLKELQREKQIFLSHSETKNESTIPGIISENQQKKQHKGNGDKRNYSLRQVCIAYHFMENVNQANAAMLLKLHTRHSSVAKLLQKVITKTSELTTLSENKTADTKKLNDLKAAKRLISGKKNKAAEQLITHAITQFKTNYEQHY